MPALHELRLTRRDHNLCDLHRKLPPAAIVIKLRYTKTELVALYKL